VLAPRRIVSRPRRAMTYALSAAASLSAAALVAWVAVAPTQDPALVAGTKAPAPLAAAVAAKPDVQPAGLTSVQNDGSMNDLLFYHQGVSPSTIMQGVSTYIRTVSTTRRADGR
jgi:hypothetical protein